MEQSRICIEEIEKSSTQQVVVSRPPKVPVKLFTLSVGILMTNVFAPQILIGLMSASFGLTTAQSGMMAMMTLLGYSSGLFFLVPLADLIENRRLVICMLICIIIALIGVITAQNITTLFIGLFVLGAGSSATQVLMPAAAAMTTPELRGQVLGNMMSGVMTGILLSRPIASGLAGTFGWVGFFWASISATIFLGSLLYFKLPKHKPEVNSTYGKLIKSLWELFTEEPILRKRAISAAIGLAAFNFFWTTIVYVLAKHPFNLNQIGVALFAITGAGAAIVTPLVGRLADKGLGAKVTMIAPLILIAGFVLSALCGIIDGPKYILLLGLALSAVMLDIGVLGDQTVGRYMINQIHPEARGRMNGIFSGVFFIGGALGSALSSVLWSSGGWSAVCAGGVFLGVVLVLIHKPKKSLLMYKR